MFRPGHRRGSVSLPLIGLCLLSAAILLASGTGLSSQAPGLNVDLTDTGKSVAHKGVALAVPFPGNLSVTFPPYPFTGQVVVTLQGKTDANWSVAFDKNPLTFTKTDTQPFVFTVSVPAALAGINTTTVYVNASATVSPAPPTPYPVDSDTATLTIASTTGGTNHTKPGDGNKTGGNDHNTTNPNVVPPPWYVSQSGALTAAAAVVVVVCLIYFIRVRKGRAGGAAVKAAPKPERASKKPPTKEPDD